MEIDQSPRFTRLRGFFGGVFWRIHFVFPQHIQNVSNLLGTALIFVTRHCRKKKRRRDGKYQGKRDLCTAEESRRKELRDRLKGETKDGEQKRKRG